MSSHCDRYPSCSCPPECGLMCGLNPSLVDKVSITVLELQKVLPWCSREELIFSCLKPLKEWDKEFNEVKEREFKEFVKRYLMNKVLNHEAYMPDETVIYPSCKYPIDLRKVKPLYSREQFTFGKRPGSNITPSKKKRKKK